MNKKLFILTILICPLLLFVSCGTDDDNTYSVSQEWKDYNNNLVLETSNNPQFRRLPSTSNNGNVYYRNITDFIPDDKQATIHTRVTSSGTPYFTDSVIVRYEGYYYQTTGTKNVFYTTEGDNNSTPKRTRVRGFIDGMATVLQAMVVDDQVEVCIPYRLGYGEYAEYDKYGNVIIPGYTTLWYKVKLMNIYDEDTKSWVKN